MDQISLERESIKVGKDRYLASVAKAKKQRNLQSLKPEMKFVQHNVQPLAQAIEKFTEENYRGPSRYRLAKGFLSRVDPWSVAFLTLRVAIFSNDSVPIQRVALRVSKQLILNDNYQQLKAKMEPYVKKVEEGIRSKNQEHRERVFRHLCAKFQIGDENNFSPEEQLPGSPGAGLSLVSDRDNPQ